MDIEGYEYVTLINTPDELLKRFRIIIIEFHDLEKLWHKGYYHFVSQAFEKILKTHTCVHIHPNNCCGVDVTNGIGIPRLAEFTFLRNDRISEREPAIEFPHKLDADCDPYKQFIPLSESWYMG